MKLRFLSLILVLATARASAGDPPAHQLYAAVGMTKAQKNTSIPLDSGVYVRDAAGNWTIFGPRILGVCTVAMSPVDPKIVLLGGGDGVVRTKDGGAMWRRVTGWEVADVRCIVFDRKSPNKVFAATTWGALRSEDAGETWQVADQGLAKPYCQTIVADAATSGRLLLGTEDGVYLSRDGARSWQRAKFPGVTVLRLAQSGADPKLFIAGTEGRGLWLSGDAGKTWANVDPATATANLYAVALSPHDASQAAAGGWNVGVRVSSDGGKTWSDRTAGLPVRHVFVLVFDPDVKGRLWASTFEEGTFFSDDLGVTWQDGGLYGAYASDMVFLKSVH